MKCTDFVQNPKKISGLHRYTNSKNRLNLTFAPFVRLSKMCNKLKMSLENKKRENFNMERINNSKSSS